MRSKHLLAAAAYVLDINESHKDKESPVEGEEKDVGCDWCFAELVRHFWRDILGF